MKSDKKLQALFESAKDPEGIKQYCDFQTFKRNCKEFVKDCRNWSTCCSMYVSKSGMLRKFNFSKAFNSVLNVCYHGKYSHEPVRVGGCGMDMHWHLKYRACEELCTKKEVEKWSLNYKCSSGRIL